MEVKKFDEFDIPILKRRAELSHDTGIWSKNDDRSCEPQDIQLSIYCALQQASVEISGKFEHRAAALQEVRYAIDRMLPDADYAHRLMDFNNDPEVTIEDIHLILQNCIESLRKKKMPMTQRN